MSWLSNLFSANTVEPIKAVGDIIDDIWTSDEEELNLEIVKQRLEARPHLAQAKINEVQASHRSRFVAGARPFLLWVCGVGYGFAFIINPLIQWATSKPGPELPMEAMGELTLGMLGLAGLRTVEKLKGTSK